MCTCIRKQNDIPVLRPMMPNRGARRHQATLLMCYQNPKKHHKPQRSVLYTPRKPLQCPADLPIRTSARPDFKHPLVMPTGSWRPVSRCFQSPNHPRPRIWHSDRPGAVLAPESPTGVTSPASGINPLWISCMLILPINRYRQRIRQA
jgi:hypothetical protein